MALVGGCQHPFARSREGLIRNGRLDSCWSLACLGCFGSSCATIPNLFSKSHDGALSFHSTRTVAMIAASFTTGGSLTSIRTHPVQWTFSLVVAFLDGFGLYLLVGMCCWPFLSEGVAQVKQSNDNMSVFLLVFIASGTLLMSMWMLLCGSMRQTVGIFHCGRT